MPSIDFEGKRIEFAAGDSIAAALYRAGVRVFSRSFKYHRRRGLYCLTGDCPNCLMRVDGVPAVRSCCMPAREGQVVARENAWPSAGFDLMATAWRLRWLTPVGFYYKTMVRPWVWRLGEPLLRRAAGLGKVPVGLRPANRVATHHHADVAVVGGGVAGLAAATAAAEAGESVVLIDEGGVGEKIPPGATRDRVEAFIEALRGRSKVTLLEHTAAVGVYEGPLVPAAGLDQMHLVHPGRVVVATGAVEEHVVVPGSDLPGVWLGRGAARMAGVHGVAPARSAVLVAGTEESAEHAEILRAAGVGIAAILAPSELASSFPEGSRLRADGRLLAVKGRKRVRAAVIDSDAGRETIRCDAVICSLSLLPRSGLLRQAVEEPVVGAGEVVVPGCSLEEAVESGLAAVAAGIPENGDVTGESDAPGVLPTGPIQAPLAPPGPGFVCLCEDVRADDFERAWEEGYQSTELLKRYTTATMGPCQGAMCGAHMRAFVAARATEPAFHRPTTARPPARPVRVEDAAAGLRYVVENRTALHDRHLEMGAEMAWFGSWKRPDHYGNPEAEYDAVRNNVSIMDVGTLGKFLINGPDATDFLERLYPSHVHTIEEGRLKYSLLLNEAGYIVDDGLICSLGSGGYYVTFTTAGAEQGESWLKDWAETWGSRVHVVNQTAAVGAINVAGPGSRELLARLCDAHIGAEEFPFAAHRGLVVAGVQCRALRLGFVGELGFELHHRSSDSVKLWDALLEAGEPMGLVPHGVQALLLLRLEKGHLVVGMDTDFDTTPDKADLGWVVKMEKEYFVGKVALARLAAIPLEKKLHGVVFAGDTAPPEGTTLTVDGEYAGMLSSSRYSPALEQGVALGWLRRREDGFPRTVQAEGRSGAVAELPFYDPEGERLRD